MLGLFIVAEKDLSASGSGYVQRQIEFIMIFYFIFMSHKICNIENIPIIGHSCHSCNLVLDLHFEEVFNYLLKKYLLSAAFQIFPPLIFQISDMAARRGALILFEGIDRCGKSTQTQLLHDHFQSTSRPVELMRFPSENSHMILHGRLINRFRSHDTDRTEDQQLLDG